MDLTPMALAQYELGDFQIENSSQRTTMELIIKDAPYQYHSIPHRGRSFRARRSDRHPGISGRYIQCELSS